MPRPAPPLRLPLLLVALVVAAGCSGAAPSATPAATPRPTPTVDPHLTDPASVDIVLARLARMGVPVRTNTATRGLGGEPLKTVNATLVDWPLSISEFSSTAMLHELRAIDAAAPPAPGEAPFLITGLNILVEYGPPVVANATPPDERYLDAARQLAAALEPLLGPLEQRGVGTGTPSPGPVP